MTEHTDAYYGRFSALLPSGPGLASERPAEEPPRKKREPRTRFTCLLPLPPEGFVMPVYRRGKGRAKSATMAESAPERPAEAARAAPARG